MRPKRVAVGLELMPASARILYQPVGVVGIISPWNYPFNLAIVPLVAEELPDLSGVPVFIAGGLQELPVYQEQTRRLAELLRAAGANVTLHWQEATHALAAPEDLRDFSDTTLTVPFNDIEARLLAPLRGQPGVDERCAPTVGQGVGQERRQPDRVV